MKALRCTEARPTQTPAREGFTLVELLVVLTVLGFALLMFVPALAHTQPQARAVRCLNNLRQMQVGWRAYAGDFTDLMLPNAPAGVSVQNAWCGGQEDWHTAAANVNSSFYLQGLLAPYIQNQIGLYKCPGDAIPSDNGQRIRSYSMNGQMGKSYGVPNPNPAYLLYAKLTDLVGSVPPSMGMVFLEENMSSLNDGYLQMSLTTALWPDLPGSYHNGAMGVSFADGHTELHQWATASILVPVRYGYTGSNFSPSGGTSNPDWLWCKAHAAAPIP